MFSFDDDNNKSANQNFVSPPVTQSLNPLELDPFGFTDSNTKPLNNNNMNPPIFSNHIPQQNAPINYGIQQQSNNYSVPYNYGIQYPQQPNIQPQIYPQQYPQQNIPYQGYPNMQINNNSIPPYQGGNQQPITLNYGNFPTYSKPSEPEINSQSNDNSNSFKVSQSN